jgi:transposase
MKLNTFFQYTNTELMRTKIREKKSFSEENIYIGIDVHKKSWSITILTDYLEHKTYNQSPDTRVLTSYLERNFPGGNYLSCYEAGFSGFWLHRQLEECGIKNIVINAADVPSSNKDSQTKTDHVDSRKLAKALRAKMLTGIFIPERKDQERRSLSRYRLILMRDLRRSKTRIKSLLQYYGIHIPEALDNGSWSNAFVLWLKTIKMEQVSGDYCLDILIRNYEFNYGQILEVGKKLRSIFREEEKEMYNLLKSIPGIGPITAIALISELGPTDRFRKTSQLASFVGLTPRLNNSGERERTSGITYRSNKYLRSLIIEASWMAIRKDPALMKYYMGLRSRMIGQKAIVKVARKLLNRIRFVMKNKVEYTIGIEKTEPVI